jgi:hypothetical protein
MSQGRYFPSGAGPIPAVRISDNRRPPAFARRLFRSDWKSGGSAGSFMNPLNY